jgi:ribosomal protein L40E
MILAGKKNADLKCEIAPKVICPKCNATNSTEVTVIGTYKHLLYIPFFAGKKFGKSICTHCHQTYNLNNMPDAIKLAYYELKEISKTPYWFYIGSLSIKILVLIKIFSRYV